jgi:hypothetical protein
MLQSVAAGAVSLSGHLTAHRLHWLGVLLRMGDGGCPKQVLFSLLHGAETGAVSPTLELGVLCTSAWQDLLGLGLS